MSSSTNEPLQERTPLLEQLASALEQLAALPAPSPAKIKSLKQEYGDDLTRDLLTAAKLQAKAREKLGQGTWWITEQSLQQATPWQVAEVKSRWFADMPVYDLCCGIGGDARQLARRGPVVGVDLDERLVRMAAANLSTQPAAAVVCADALTYARLPSAAIHIDPDRRSDGRRSSRPEAYSPTWSEVTRLVDEAKGSLVKLAPAARIEDSESPESHRVWISLRGSVREQSWLCGEVRERFLAIHGADAESGRSALMVDRNGEETVFAPLVPSHLVAEACELPGELMVDPDAAIRAAGLTHAFAVQYGLSPIGGPAGFLTGTAIEMPPQALAISEQVLWAGSGDDRQLRRALRSRNAYPSRIKTRGVGIDPAKLEKRLRDCGDQPITLWIGRNSRRQYAVMTQISGR